MDKIRRMAIVSDYIPRRCGIAQYTHDLYKAMKLQTPKTDVQIVAVNDTKDGYSYPEEVCFEISEEMQEEYERAADYLHVNNMDVVSLQHEFGIYGGASGSHILPFLKSICIPVVTTLHTILQNPNVEQKHILQKIGMASTFVVTMTEKGRDMLRDVYEIEEDKIEVIPHGIPDMPFVDPNFYKDQFGVEGKYVILTFGLLSPNKGIENMIKALPKIIKEVPNTVYIVLGATHPHLIRDSGESYRLELTRLVERLGVKDNVIFYNRFVSDEELREFLGMADVYVTPYLNETQITSGTLSYAFGCGKAVVSTPYWHAVELLADNKGLLVPFQDSRAMADAVVNLLKNESERHAMRKRAYLMGREMTWAQVGGRYVELFERARRSTLGKVSTRYFTVRTLADSPRRLPELKLDHLKRLTDETGLIQHAKYSIPNRFEGYCTDDNARALILMEILKELGVRNEDLTNIEYRYAAFLNHAFEPTTKVFRNFYSYDRQWIDEQISADCQGRAVWAMGTVIGRSEDEELVSWAVEIFNAVLPVVLEYPFIRAWAFTARGIYEYVQRFQGDRTIRLAANQLMDRFVDAFRNESRADWKWFEEKLAYENARLSEATILLSILTERQEALDIGLESLRWLDDIQRSEQNNFRPIGNRGFFHRGGTPAYYDQQPVEAAAMVSASIAAYIASEDDRWRENAHRSFEWFLGRNDLSTPLYDPKTGGCFDGLMVDRVNRNMGGESTLSFLLSLAEMKLLENRLAAYESAEKPAMRDKKLLTA
ncbi:MAG TPA: glycosyltransferase [Mesotoga infera]|uniref:Glycosyltransferase n=1 Tax=Mesotoga infera TaxID=1236046 RepID=A0A7C1H686_9BACT|nr:glycosyltransferase [Mesotoga infera]